MKKDIKYIIKRIIIGVGIALILGFLGKKGVLAESVSYNYCITLNNNSQWSVSTSCDISSDNSYQFIMYENSIVGNSYWNYIATTAQTTGISIGLENTTNSDLLLFDIPQTTFNGQKDSIGFYNYQSNGYMPTLYNAPFNENTASFSSSARAIFVTTEYARALDYQQDSIFTSGLYPVSTPTIQQVDNYYFVYGEIWLSNGLSNYFQSFDWVYNRLYYSSFYQNIDLPINFINSSGQVDFSVNFTDTSNTFNTNNYWQQGFDSGGDDFINNSCSDGGLCATNITGYIDLLKLPFNFLRGLSKDNCQPLNIPIPFVGGNIQINCLSSIFTNVLGNFSSIILYIITGLYAYRITILNIDTITDVLDPQDDKLEVVDL